MNCFPCCGPKKSNSKREHGSPPPEPVTLAKAPDMKKQKPEEQIQADASNIKVQAYTFRELATATKNFRQETLLDEGGFGRVYKGIIPATGKAVAVKQLDRNGMQSSKEFLAEVSEISLLTHENLVSLVGYCADGDQRLLVYELFPGRTLENRLFEHKEDEGPLSWYDRMKIAAGTSKGLEYLHETANPPVIFRDLKTSSILINNDHHAKLRDVAMTKFSGGDKMSNAPPRLMGTYGHCAPEYVRAGQITMKSDVYSFGVVLLELITGRRAIDTTRSNEEQNLVSWATPLFRDPKRYPDMADPVLNKNFPEKDLNQVVAIASMCLQEEAEARPLISDVVTALSFLSAAPVAVPKKSVAVESERESESGSESEGESESGSEAMSSKRSSISSVDGSQLQPVVSSKPSRKSSSRSRKEAHGSDSGDGSVSSSSKSSRKSHGHLSQKSSRKSSVKDLSQKSSRKSSVEDLGEKCRKKSSAEDLSQKSSRKSSVEDLGKKSSRKSSSIKDLSQKSSRKSSIKDLSQKSSKKSSGRALSHKSSMASEDGSMSSSCRSSSVASEDEGVRSERSSMRLSQGSAHSDSYSSRRTEDQSMHLIYRASSLLSDEGSGHPFDQTSSSGSSVYSR